MKIIKLEAYKLPDKYNLPTFELAVAPKLNAAKFSNIDEITDVMDVSEYRRDVYEKNIFCLGSYYEHFYIRKKDEEAFLELFKRFINKAELDLLNKIEKDYFQDNKIYELVQELKLQKTKE